MTKQLIEFYYYKDGRTGSRKLDLLEDNKTLATLDYWDFVRMGKLKLNVSYHKDVVKYCNEYKGTSIGEFDSREL